MSKIRDVSADYQLLMGLEGGCKLEKNSGGPHFKFEKPNQIVVTSPVAEIEVFKKDFIFGSKTIKVLLAVDVSHVDHQLKTKIPRHISIEIHEPQKDS